jgi:CheY-like chemotaxis protein
LPLARWTSYVLVVDLPLRDLYRSALRAVGYAVVAVGDGLEALHVVESHCPAAVVLDLDLPAVNGSDVYEEPQRESRDPRHPHRDRTGNDDEDMRFACVVLKKPITTDQLIAAVDKCFRR